MGGFLSALGGFGQAAQPYNDRMLQLTEDTRRQGAQHLARLLETTPMNSQRYAEGQSLLGKIVTAKPGADLTPLFKKFTEFTQVHPNNISIFKQTGLLGEEPAPPKPEPGPAGPGETPGRGTLLNKLAPPPAASAAQPSTSLAQGGGPGPNADPMAAEAMSGMQGPQSPPPIQPIGPPNVQAIMQSAPPLMPMPQPQAQPQQTSALDRFQSMLGEGMVSPALARMIEPLMLDEQRGSREDARLGTQFENQKKLLELGHTYDAPIEMSPGATLMSRTGQTLGTAPAAPKAATVHSLSPGGMLVDEKGATLATAPFRPGTGTRLQQKSREDKDGNVWTWTYDPDTGESTDPQNMGKIGKMQTPGSFVPLFDPQSQALQGFYNPKTGVSAANPMPGASTKTLPGAEMDRRTYFTETLTELQSLADLAARNKDRIGPIMGRLTGVQLNTIGSDNPELAEIFRISGNLGDMLLRARSGAQISGPEYDRLRKLVPDPNTPLSTFMSRLNSFRQEVNRTAATRTGGVVGDKTGGTGGQVEEWVRGPDGRLVRK